MFRNALSAGLCLVLAGLSATACDSPDHSAGGDVEPTVSVLSSSPSVALYTLLQYLSGLSKGEVEQMNAVLCTEMEDGEALIDSYHDYVSKHGPIKLRTGSVPDVRGASVVQVVFLVGANEFDASVTFGEGKTAFGNLCIEEIVDEGTLPLGPH